MGHPDGTDGRPVRHPAVRGGRAGSALTCALVLLAGLVGAGPAGASTDPGGASNAVAARAWDRAGTSVHADPADVVADAPTTGPVRVVTLRSVHGQPQVRVRTVSGREAAQDAVAAAQDRPGTVGIALDAPVAALTDTWDDTLRDLQWGLDRLRAEETAARTRATGVTVAVVDTGVDDNHPDLAGTVLPGNDFVAPGGDGTADGNGHGTHVAGIVAALADNATGVAGFAPGASILPVRVLDDDGAGYDSGVAQGIVWAADHGASVINLSLGGAGSSDVLAAAVGYARSRGAVVVAAAGNSRATGNPVTYPAAYPGVIGVAASAADDSIASFSNTGGYVDLAAPGVGIASTYRAQRYVSLSGTSMAAPFVAAAAAVLRAADPALTADRVASLLESTATDLGPVGRDDESGSGLVDPLAALCGAVSCAGEAPAPVTGPAPAETPAPTTDLPADVPADPPALADPPVPVPVSTATRLLTTPAVVTYGSSITGTGELVDAGTGAGLPGAEVQVCTRPRPATAFTCTSRTTDAAGRFSYALPARSTTAVYAAHPGSAGTTASASPVLTHAVSSRATLTARRATVAATVSAAARQRVTLQRWTGARWVGTDVARVGRRGVAAFADLRAGRYRVKVAATPTLAPVTSRPVRVRG